MTAIWLILIFVAFCCIVAWLVRREEERQYNKFMRSKFENMTSGINALPEGFKLVQLNLEPLGENIKKLQEALAWTPPYNRDPHRRVSDVKSDKL